MTNTPVLTAVVVAADYIDGEETKSAKKKSGAVVHTTPHKQSVDEAGFASNTPVLAQQSEATISPPTIELPSHLTNSKCAFATDFGIILKSFFNICQTIIFIINRTC